jgi:Family of unknown function (DUF6152)
MQRRSLVPIAVALALGAFGVSSTVVAHHSYARFDRCHLFTLAGEIEHVTWHNPHVELAIRSSEGTAYTIVWLNLPQLKRDGVEPGALRVGDRIEITGAKQPEDNLHVITLLTAIRRLSDGWRWSRPPQGC